MGRLARNRRPLAWLLLIGVLIFSGCSGTVVEGLGQTTPAVVQPTEAAAVPEADPIEVDEVPTATMTAPAATPAATEVPRELPPEPTATPAEPTATPEPTEAPTETPPPTPRPGLEATDPATLQLASGQVQLVEFFAFW